MRSIHQKTMVIHTFVRAVRFRYDSWPETLGSGYATTDKAPAF